MTVSNSVFRFTSFYNPSALEQNESPFRERPLTEEEAFAKMVKNSQKALIEHKAAEPSAYASLEDLSFPSATTPLPEEPLNFTTYSASSIGSKKVMEDVSFVMPIPNGLVAGVLDGHNGDKVANFASTRFQEIFPSILEKTQEQVHKALEVTSGIIQKEILQNPSMNVIGSPAVFSVFDSIKHQVTTTTIGDSESNIYRKKEGKTFSIPLSCVRDWSSKKDEARAKAAHSDPRYFFTYNSFHEKVLGWPLNSTDRRLKSDDFRHSTNVSRAFGKSDYAGSCTHKGKTTVAALKKDDIVIVTSDGLKYHKESDIVNIVEKNTINNLSNALVNYATSHPGSDNVSAIVIHVT